jgi:molybdopterin biosynthesis enzyme MoaB
MTKKFDALLEAMLAEMMPAGMMYDFGPEEMTSAVGKKIEELPGKSQHWGPLQKLSSEDRSKIIRAIINNVFTEKENTYTPMADDRDQLKELIKSAIVKATKDHPEFKAGGKWAVQFLADRLANEELLGKVKYTTEGGEEIKKNVTQKEINAALNKVLSDTKGQSVWKKSSQAAEEPTKEETEQETVSDEEAGGEEEQGELNTYTRTVYFKVPGFDSDDSKVQAAYNKIPDEKDMSWEEVIKLVGTSKAIAILDNGGLKEEQIEKEIGEEEEVPDLDPNEDDGPDMSKFDRLINPYYSDTRGSFERFHGDY